MMVILTFFLSLDIPLQTLHMPLELFFFLSSFLCNRISNEANYALSNTLMANTCSSEMPSTFLDFPRFLEREEKCGKRKLQKCSLASVDSQQAAMQVPRASKRGRYTSPPNASPFHHLSRSLSLPPFLSLALLLFLSLSFSLFRALSSTPRQRF